MSDARERTGTEETLSSIRPLDERQAGRVAERMDRLQSQLLAASEPPSLDAAHERFGTKPVRSDEFEAD